MKPAWETLCADMEKKCPQTTQVDIKEDYHTQTKIKDQLKNPYKLQEFTYAGVPTIYRIPKQGTVELYEGERTPEKMMSWMIKSPVKQSVSILSGRNCILSAKKKKQFYKKAFFDV